MMANPNITDVEDVRLSSSTVQVSSSTVVIEGTLNKVIKTQSIIVCNTSNEERTVTVELLTNSGSTSIVDSVTVPAYSTLNVLDSDIPLYLSNGDCIKANSSDFLDVITSYSVISSPIVQNINTNNLIFFIDPANTSCYSGSGTTVNDLSSYGRTGTLAGVGFDSDSKTFTFDGVNDYITFGTIATSDPLTLSSPSGTGLTIIAITKPDSTTPDAFPRIIEKATGGSGADGWTLFYGTGPTALRFMAAGGSTDFSAGAVPKNDTWESVAVTLQDGPLTLRRMYVNGVGVGNSGSATYNIPNVAGELLIGAWYDKIDRLFKGNIGPVLVYDTFLSQSEIQDIIGSFNF